MITSSADLVSGNVWVKFAVGSLQQMDTKSAAILKLETQFSFTAYTLISEATQYSNA